MTSMRLHICTITTFYIIVTIIIFIIIHFTNDICYIDFDGVIYFSFSIFTQTGNRSGFVDLLLSLLCPKLRKHLIDINFLRLLI